MPGGIRKYLYTKSFCNRDKRSILNGTKRGHERLKATIRNRRPVLTNNRGVILRRISARSTFVVDDWAEMKRIPCGKRKVAYRVRPILHAGILICLGL